MSKLNEFKEKVSEAISEVPNYYRTDDILNSESIANYLWKWIEEEIELAYERGRSDSLEGGV